MVGNTPGHTSACVGAGRQGRYQSSRVLKDKVLGQLLRGVCGWYSCAANRGRCWCGTRLSGNLRLVQRTKVSHGACGVTRQPDFSFSGVWERFLHTISQAIKFPLLAGSNSVALYSVSTISWSFQVGKRSCCRFFWQTWAVSVLTRGSLQGFLSVGKAAMLFLVSKRVQAPTSASPTAGPSGSCSGLWILSCLLQAAAPPALSTNRVSLPHVLFSQNQAPLRP